MDIPEASRLSWYALTTRPQHEKKAEHSLRVQGFQTFLPLYHSRRRWSDRTKELELPLLAGYVFCRITPEQRLRVQTSPGVVSIVGVGKRPSPVAESEIASLRAIVDSGHPVEPWEFLAVGQRVRIEGGSLDGLTGLLVQEKSSLRVVVSVTLLQRSVAVEISRDRLALEKQVA